jgi:hypothetical protein
VESKSKQGKKEGEEGGRGRLRVQRQGDTSGVEGWMGSGWKLMCFAAEVVQVELPTAPTRAHSISSYFSIPPMAIEMRLAKTRLAAVLSCL